MKPFLGIDHTTDKKNTNTNGAELYPQKPSPELETALENAAINVGAAFNKAKLPLPLRILGWICHFVLAVVVIGVLRSLGGEDAVTFSQIIEKAPWIFVVGGVALALGGILHFVGKKHAKNVMESDESKHSIAQLESLSASVYSDLGVPDNARNVDIISVSYKEKNGEIKLESVVFDNPEFKIFADKDYFYLADLRGKYQFSRDAIRGIRTLKKNLMVKDWNKDEPYNSEKYKKYKISVDKYNRIYCNPCYILEVNIDGKLWGIYFPPYELPLFEALSGLKAE